MNEKLIHKNIHFSDNDLEKLYAVGFLYMNSCCCKAFDLNRSEGAAKYFSGIYFFLIFKLSLQGKTRLKFNEV